jgi:undecaprenyl-diphosphatase
MFGVGALVAAGAVDFWAMCAWAVTGAVLGDSLSYALGRYYKSRLREVWPFRRYPAMLAHGEQFFHRYGGVSVAFGRFFGPGRATVPLVAGMLDMQPRVFLLANVGSALLWAPAYLLPGVVLGASLQLASEVAFGLVILLVLLIALIWTTGWLAHRLFALVQPHAGDLLRRVLALGARFGWLRRIVEAIGNPEHPEARGLTAFAALLFLAAGLLGLVSALLADSQPWAAADQLVARVMASLRSESAERLLRPISVDVPLAFVAAAGGLAALGLAAAWRSTALRHWLANLSFLAIGLGILQLFDRHRPGSLVPDTGVLTASVCWGLLAVMAARGVPARAHWSVYSIAVILVMLTGFARLYLELTNLGGVITGLLLGVVWVAGIGVAYRTHALDEPLGGRSALVVTLGFVAGAYLATLAAPAPVAVTPTEAHAGAPLEGWRRAGWEQLPLIRDDLRQTSAQALNLQYAGPLAILDRRLREAGWQRVETADAAELLRSLSPSVSLQQLPLLPHVHAGRHETADWSRPDGDNRLVLRLWPSGRRVEGAPLWIGAVSMQRKRERFGLVAYAETTDAFAAALAQLRTDLGAVDRPLKQGPRGPVWLVDAAELGTGN